MENYGIKIKWLSVASFEIEKNGATVVTDPFFTANQYSPCNVDSVENCDYITLSHCHWDHIPDIPALYEKFRPRILCGTLTAEPLCRWADMNPYYVYPMESDLELDFDNIKIKALFGKHVDLKREWSGIEKRWYNNGIVDEKMGLIQPIGTLDYRNYLFTYPDGLKVLIWGNPLVSFQKNILRREKPDIAILQATGQISNPQKFAEFVAEFSPKIVIPHHMDLSHPVEKVMDKLLAAKEAVEKTSPGTKFIIPVHGEWIEL